MFPTQSDPATWFDCKPTHPPVPLAILELERTADAAWQQRDRYIDADGERNLHWYALLDSQTAECLRLDDALQAAKREQHEPEYVHRGAAIAAECGVRVDDD